MSLTLRPLNNLEEQFRVEKIFQLQDIHELPTLSKQDKRNEVEKVRKLFNKIGIIHTPIGLMVYEEPDILISSEAQEMKKVIESGWKQALQDMKS